MLKARRFTTVPTKDCQDRLEAALANQRPIAQGESHHGAVVAIQAALADLNRGYLLSAEVDGFFGHRTYAAVESFQRDYGLAADGMVGRQTMQQLDQLYGPDVVRQPLGKSIHVGINRLDAKHYGNEFALASCVNDARRMRELAQRIGYDAVVLEDEDATVSRFTGLMRTVSSELFAGDSLLVTFSGHGSQLPDTSVDPEADLMDETLCFFDRMLLDDELYALLSDFREGVRVHAVFDSCHSGTVAKALFSKEVKDAIGTVQQQGHDEKVKAGLDSLDTIRIVAVVRSELGAIEPFATDDKVLQPFSAATITQALDGDPSDPAPRATYTENRAPAIVGLFSDLYTDTVMGEDKEVGLADYRQIYDGHKELYDAIKSVVGPKENQELACTLITLSACQDPQTTPAGRVLSLFTYNIVSAWGLGGFPGSYRQFHRNLQTLSPAGSTPEIGVYGSSRAEARLYDRPFVF